MRKVFLIALSFSAAVFGCNQILGIDEAEPIGDAALGGSSATGATGGGAGTTTGGSGGTAGSDASVGGTAGAGGSAGSGGTDASPCVDVQNDPQNCGWCGHSCGGTSCAQGLCASIEVTALEAGAQAMRLDGSSVFVSGGWSWQFNKIPKAGGTVESWTGASDIDELAIHAGFAYFTEYNPKKIYKTSTAAAPAPTLVLTSSSILNSLAVDASGIYYAENGTDTIRRAPLAGSPSIDLVTKAYDAWSMALDDTDLYFSRVNDGIFRVSKTATPPFDESALPYFHDIIGDGPVAILLDTDWVYFSTGDPSYNFTSSVYQVLRKSKTSGTLQTIASTSTLVWGIAVADGYAYWAEEGTLQQDYTDGAVRRVQLDSPGAQPETLAKSQNHPVQVAVDGPWVYFLNAGWTGITGGVRRVAR